MRNNFNPRSAFAVIKGDKDAPRLSGRVQFLQRQNGVLVVANIKGLPRDNPSGFFAFHIHEGESCKGEDFPETKGHLNLEHRPHPQHSGDLPPLLSCDGFAYMSVFTDRFSVRDIIGRTVVIHGSFDNFSTQPSGNSGEKIGCGEIKPMRN